MNQLVLHKQIDELLASPTKATKEAVTALINTNPDARQYFFTQADERWLDWLLDNGFLDVIKEKAEDQTRYGYKAPELNYLVKMAATVPDKVVDIMLDFPISTDTNHGVLDRFLWICSTLPAEQLARLVTKLRDERWIPLMGTFNRWGFEYEKMLKTLADAKNNENILTLAEAILTVRTGEDVKKIANSFGSNKPFYIDDLSHTKVFEHLASVSEKYAEQVLSLTTKVMAEIILFGGKTESDTPFSTGDMFYLFDVDFFDLKPRAGRHLSDRDDVRELAAVITVMLRRLTEDKCGKPEEVRAVYEKYVGDFDNPKANLPDSRTLWRLRLFVLSLCPEIFKGELKKAFFRLFEAKERYHDIISGAEYQKALQKGFSALSDADKRQYVERLITFFGERARDARDEEEKGWHKRYGSRILSVITDNLTADEKQKAKDAGFVLDLAYEPEPSISQTHAGTIVPQAPGVEDDWKKTVPEIVARLKTDWAPKTLKEKYKSEDDFLRPHDATGVAERMKAEMAVRPGEFMEHATLFFDRKNLDAHYTYAFLQYIYDLVREKKTPEGADFTNIFALMHTIATSAPFEEKSADRKEWGWLAHWDSVHNAMADLLKEMLGGGEKMSVDFKTNRDSFFGLIKYLLGYDDPSPQDEELGTAKSTTTPAGSKGAVVSDPFTMAINSVRGRAFQALVNFSYRDAQLFPKDEKSKLAPDTKTLYEETLGKENTRAIMFMFGHYLPSFYFRDKEWVRGSLPKIFSTTPEKKYLYLAAWEGYLANNLYQEMFSDPDIQKLYERGIALMEPEDPSRKHFKDPDEGLAVHLALAFMYYKDFGFEHQLFKTFWDGDSERHGQFVSFLGRMFVSGDNANANKLLKESPLAVERLKEFWDWALSNYKDSKLFTEFGFWINLDKGLFKVVWLADHVKNTLEKTRGALDWDYGLMRSVTQFAKEAPEDTLSIARSYLLEGGVRGSNLRVPIHIDDEWLEALKTLYDNLKTKTGTYALIDDLVREGGSAFWGLKKIVE